MPDKSDLTALIGSRICHDLISPIGAISNGLELLMLDGQQGGPEMVLIAESVANANARIRYFRVAYGLANPDQRIGRPEVLSILTDMTSGGRLHIDWQSGNDLSRGEVKIVFLLLQCLESAMAYGGRVVVVSADDKWQITGHADKLKINTDLWEVLANPNASPEITPALVQFPLVAEELLRRGYRLRTTLGQSEIHLEF